MKKFINDNTLFPEQFLLGSARRCELEPRMTLSSIRSKTNRELDTSHVTVPETEERETQVARFLHANPLFHG